MRKVSDKICRENRNTHFMISDFFPKAATFMVYYYYYEGWNFNSGNYLFTTDTK